MPVVSRSSSATIRALAATECAMAYSRAAGSPASSVVAVRLAPFEEGEIVDQAVFDDFGIARAQLAGGQRVEHVAGRSAPARAGGTRRSNSCRRGVLIAVLPPTELSTCASSVVGIWTKPQPRLTIAAGEPDQVADHPAAERDDMIAALDAVREQAIGQRFQLAPSSWCLRRAAGRSPRSRCRRRRAPPASVARCGATFSSLTIAIGRPRASGARCSAARPSSPRSITTRIAAIAERDGDFGHASSQPIAFRIATTVDSCGAWSLAMRIGACA